MMRSLYSAVSGLKTHQTKMDVIGNNISNVNTVAFKSSSVTFSSIMYQTLSGASGANAEAGTGGINAKQIGLGVTTGSTAMTITSAGASETTGLPFDLKITDQSTSSFFIVNTGSENLFTKAGSFYVDGAGNLCMKSTGYTVMGWGVDSETQTIRKDTVSALKVMSAENMTSTPEATTKARCTGVVDSTNTQLSSSTGSLMNLTVYDNLGYPYTARFSIQAQDTQGGKYAVNLTDIIDSDGTSILNSKVSLADLFGSTSAQGSNVDITDNYTFATGKSKTDLQLAIQKNATTGSDTKYTYYLDAADINTQLGLSGDSALPDGYRVQFTTTNVDVNADAVKTALGVGNTANALTVTVMNGTKEVATGIIDATSTGDGKKGVTWKFTDTTGATNTDASYNLTKTMTLADMTSLGTLVTADDGTVGYRFNVEDVATKEESTDKLYLDTDTITSSVIYYWPTLESSTVATNTETKEGDAKITLTGADGKKIYFQSKVASENGAVIKADDEPVKNVGLESLLEDYSYTTITGDNLATATNSTGSIFSEEIPSDAEIHFNLFGGGSYSIVTPANDGYTLQFNTVDGTLTSIGGGNNLSQTLNLSQLSKAGYDGFQDVTIDFSALLNYNNGGSNTAAMSGGDADGVGKGKKLGAMTGMSVDSSGKIYASYDNGNTVLLGQIAVAQFANASGLEATGDNCYRTTLNSGEFDGIGVEIDADGSSITSGELEMSNVDLATEFTSMITTQRGFQANSRVITTSDTLLEELINLKR